MQWATKPDLPRALAIIQSVLDRFPNNPSFHETRGQILVRMGRWQEGVADLEFALPQLASTSSTHSALADAYRGLGLRDLAAEHERLAKGPRIAAGILRAVWGGTLLSRLASFSGRIDGFAIPSSNSRARHWPPAASWASGFSDA